jgi:hypothetical protein
MVEHLVAGGSPRDLTQFVEIADVEIADAPGQDLAVAAKPLEGADRVGKRMRPAPVQEIVSRRSV